MSKKRDDLLYREIKNAEDALEYIQKLKNRIIGDSQKIAKLKSENKTLRKAWNGSDDYLREVTDDRPLAEVLRDIKGKGRLSKLKDRCPKCSSADYKRTSYPKFHIDHCGNCTYRKRIDETINCDE